MSLPAGYQVLPDAVHFKEFYGGYTGTCGETALTAALICAEKLGQDAETHDQAVALMLSVTAEMRANGWADANGASTLWSIAREAAIKRGASIALEYDYQEPLQQDWHGVIEANAAVRPIVLQVGQAFNLVGQDGTGNDEAGVHYHFICVVGKCADGYVVMDGDNWQIENELVIYSYATLQAADICGLLMLNVTGELTPLDSQFFKSNADGSFTCIQTGFNVQHGFLTYYEANNGLFRLGLPLDNEHEIPGKGAATIQIFERGALVWDTAKAYDNVPGVGSDSIYFAHINSGEVLSFVSALAPTSAPDPQVAQLKAQVASLQGQIAGLHSPLVAVRQVLDPIANADNELASAMKAAGF
jgi:hypothetical protein